MRKALGKGLDALLNGGMNESYEAGGENASGVQKIPLDKIIPNRYQPRKTFNEESLQGLAESLKQHGLTQPIVVVYDPGMDKYELVVGERRFRASQLAGFTEIDCIIHSKLDDKQMCALALIENIQREDLNPIETALGYKSLMQKFMISQTELGEYCGKSKAAVSNSLRLLNLEPEIQEAIKNGDISEGHGRALLMVSDEKKREVLFKKIISSKMSVRQAEEAAKNTMDETVKQKPQKTPDTLAFESSLQEALGTKVELKYGSKPSKGKLILHYNSLEELEQISQRLKNKML
ncbi:ParB/RepB/Spo0J family partition protein [Candidatus Proelusimicrobium excrementi]|uniref:ParB/RepB/Spo0J family partition protein n=1 Tax=Candidatus Proelusimicrobium excrementi TaxID=3416222 RepID=UPI003CAE3183|nr:ParB/RepB/Spo0J family partition protein [Elusimicrobiaceae bacterium]